MVTQPTLTQDQWNMVLQLLELERENLPSEIHHTDSPRVHEQLVQRLRILDDMIARIKGAPVVS